MTGLPDGADQALAPVRAALADKAETRAALLLAAAREQADAVLAAARDEASRIAAAAAAEGEASAHAAAGLRSARVRRQAQGIVLAQQDALRRELQRQVREAAVRLRQDPGYPELLAALTERCQAVLGAGAVVTEDPAGGVVAQLGTRRLDLSLPTLAAGTLESMSAEVSRLWSR